MRLVGADGEQVGIVSIEEALAASEEAKLDLVEIVPNAEPPVCRVMDYGKFVFEQKKQKQAARKSRSRFRSKRSNFDQGLEKGIIR